MFRYGKRFYLDIFSMDLVAILRSFRYRLFLFSADIVIIILFPAHPAKPLTGFIQTGTHFFAYLFPRIF